MMQRQREIPAASCEIFAELSTQLAEQGLVGPEAGCKASQQILALYCQRRWLCELQGQHRAIRCCRQ
jgi:hypothetical protein